MVRARSRRALATGVFVVVALGACGDDSSPASGVLGSFTAQDCAAATAALSAATSGGFAGLVGSGADTSTRGIDTLRRTAADAPAAVKDDVEKIAAAFQKFYADLRAAGVDFDDPASLQDPQKAIAIGQAFTEFQASGATDAITRISAHFDSVCPHARR